MGPGNLLGFLSLNKHLPQELVDAMLVRDGDRVWDALPAGVPIWTSRTYLTIQLPTSARKVKESIRLTWRPQVGVNTTDQTRYYRRVE